MKIAYIVLKGMPLGGGIEKYTEELGSRLVDRGHDVTVYTMRHYGANDGYYKGMKVKTIPTLRIRDLEKIVAAFIATASNCFDEKVDIVHLHAFGPGMYSFIPRLLGRKVVVQGHGIEWRRSRWGTFDRTFLKLTEIPSIKFPNAVTVVSKVQKEYLKERYGIESIYIPTGINPPRLEKPELIKQYGLNGGDYIFFAARLVREKGAHYLIEAYKDLNPDLKLIIAGDAKHEDKYKAELHNMGKGNKKIIFTGFITGKILDELFSNCYLFVLPSEIEGLPIVLLEAMSYGNCCLVSDIPENREALDNNGYIFKNKDFSDLSRQLRFLIEHEDAVNSVKENAKKHVFPRYSWDNIAMQFEDLYKSLLS